MINWNSEDSHWCLDPRLATLKQSLIKKWQGKLPRLASQIWLSSSGTSQASSTLKLVAISKQALLVSARAVNQHLKAGVQDVWLNILPDFHVGGLGIEARANLLGNAVVRLDWQNWQPERFVTVARDAGVTLTSLVPTHVFDLVQSGLRSPKELRAVLVGGAALNSDLYLKARALGWPLLPTYGMTETGSQIATAKLESLGAKTYPRLEILKHVEVSTDDEDRLRVKSKALLTGRAYLSVEDMRWVEQSEDEWYMTQDRVKIVGEELIFLGREGRMVKILGELVDLDLLENKLRMEIGDAGGFRLCAKSDARQGSRLILVLEHDLFRGFRPLINKFCLSVRGFEVPSHLLFVERLPRTPLGKINDQLLEQML